MFALVHPPAALSARASAPLGRADARRASRSPAPAIRVGCRASSAIPPSDDARPDARARVAAAFAAVALATTPAAFAKPPPSYVADLVPTKGSDVAGSVRFETTLNKSNQEIVVITANIRGLTPGAHALNVHENGDVTCDDASCTGASFNPQDRPHGAPDALKKFGASACHYVGEGCLLWRHIGDLGNVVADPSGVVDVSFKDPYVTLKPGKEANIVGRSVVVRAGADDFVTAADDGGAGRVLAYGTIKPA